MSEQKVPGPRRPQVAPGPVAEQAHEIDASFGGETLRDILNALKAANSDFARDARLVDVPPVRA